MIEKVKTVVLTLLVLLSLLQSYWLAYSMPGMGATVSQKQDYVKAEQMGTEAKVEDLIFPADIVLHFGNDRHTVLYPGVNFYQIIYERVMGREFKGFQRDNVYAIDWDAVRKSGIGVELRFGSGVPVELLSKVLKLSEGDVAFQKDVITRIWIYKSNDREEVSTYFFSLDGTTVYQSVRADLTVRDVQNYVGFGQYWTPYRYVADELYLAKEPLQAVESQVSYQSYTPEQMQHNLFFDPSATRAINDRDGSQIYTDSKRALQVEQDGTWIRYRDPAAVQDSEDDMSENVYASVVFINEHGGWNGLHRFIQPWSGESVPTIRYQQYYGSYPIVSKQPFLFGEMLLRMQQGVVTEYERSLITLSDTPEKKEVRWLPGGQMLVDALANYARREEVQSVYPAVEVAMLAGSKLRFSPIWAVRLLDGTQEKLLGAMQGATKPGPGEPGGADPAESGNGGTAAGSANGPSNDADQTASLSKTGAAVVWR
ncbi:regulatory protein YycH of two-component signal transduction system YycFG [Paenibacillus phyllosphaerae]|uniref:Regulatory protein YycH of two-component signal transduction system YycFG n=1 Tax=Paenibacillus phyllosphaerae TaxID=274593 RepID=A0A7W5AY56_9BACL|nr:two-component system activity regulator YycH [Paenibacillus phyllosphaerae]MBB3110887.1 regulatory protein YycH of two-component signal transduction system YycFG [Paenibacillus phyllosphaerae]